MQTPYEFKMPAKGIIKQNSFTDHDPAGAIDALNVMPFDRQDRFRPNQRAGTSKLWAAALASGSQPVQLLDQTTLALDPTTITASTSLANEPFTYADGNLQTVATTAVWKTYTPAGAALTTQYNVASNKVTFASGATGLAVYQPTLTLGTAYVLKMDVTVPGTTIGFTAGLAVRVNKTTPSATGVYFTAFGTSGGALTMQLGTAQGGTTIGSFTTINGFIIPAQNLTIELRVNGDVFQVVVDGIVYITATSTNQNTQSGLGFHHLSSGSVNTHDNFRVFAGANLATYRQTNLVAVAGGNIYEGDLATQATLVTGGSAQLSDTLIPQGASSAGFYYFVDGFSIRKLNLVLHTMVTYAATAGTAPALCTLACLYRDRLVLAAPRDTPQNFFLSRVGTHTDWDYTQTDTAAAFAGNASTAGHIGEPIVSLMPFSDDVLLIGGDHNLWAFRGDPADGGSIDMVSDAIGILGPNAWTKAPDGTIYFVGTGGLFKMSAGAGSVPVNISNSKWNDFFSGLSRATSYVRMVWDRDRQGAYVLVTPVNSGTTTHLFYDSRSEGFWPVQFPNSHGPVAALVYDGDGPTDRVVLFGGRTGFVQKLTQTDKSDDGTAISSRLVIGPYKNSDVTESILEWLDVILGEPQTGFASTDYNVTVSILAAQTAEKALNNPLYTRAKTFTTARRQTKWLNRTRGPYFFLKLANAVLNKTWNFEKAIGMFFGSGMVRRR